MIVRARRLGIGAFAILAATGFVTAWMVSSTVSGARGDDIEAMPDPINACDLLSPSAISAATGIGARPGVRRDAGYTSDGAYSSSCVWMLEREQTNPDAAAPLGGRSFIILNAMRWPEGRGLADTFLQAFRDAAAAGEIPREPQARNYGDAALWWGDGLAVQKGDVSFGLSVVMPGVEPGHPGEFEERLAPAILRQLGQSID